MANEGKKYFKPSGEEEKLINFYKELLDPLSETTNPSIGNQKKFLLQVLNTKISQLEPKVNKIKVIHYCLHITVMILSGTTTVLLGLKPTLFSFTLDTVNINNVVLIITAIVTFLSSLAIFWDTENYWIRNKIMLNKLKEIRYEYAFFLIGDQENDLKELKRYLNRFIASLGDEYWEKFFKEDRKINDQK